MGVQYGAMAKQGWHGPNPLAAADPVYGCGGVFFERLSLLGIEVSGIFALAWQK